VDTIIQQYFSHIEKPSSYLFLDDYAYLLVALLQLIQVDWRLTDLNLAVKLADILCEKFMDINAGGFYFTAHDHEKLIHRPKPLTDNVVPSGNGMAALGLYQLGYLLGETKYLNAAEKTLEYAFSAIQEQPYLYTTLLLVLREYINPTPIIILRGNPASLSQWKKSLKNLQKKIFIITLPVDISQLPEALLEKKWPGHDVAYLCKGNTCNAPYDNLELLLEEVKNHK
jgi:uncharacterized protein YyaL (SSP411 family)